jgi:hypothetical protein
MVSTSRLLGAAAVAVACIAGPLAAQSDEETLARYRLTDAALAKFTRASRNFIAAGKANPALLEPRDKDDDESAETIAQIAAIYDRHPPLRQGITSAGLTTREFATFMLAMFQAGMAAWLVDQQHGKFDKVPPGVPRENVLFYQRHQAELKQIGDELRALEGEKAPRPEPEDSSDG